MKIIEIKGYQVFVDDEDYDRLLKFNKWHALKSKGTVYVQTKITVKGKAVTVSMHRAVMNAVKGDIIDHKDRNGLNNQKSNLRKCSYSQNNCNRNISNGVSNFKGVTYVTRRYKNTLYNYWRCTISINGKYHYKLFKKELEAAEHYNKMAKIHHGDFAFYNNI